jgi:pyruvate dehydrogenase E2 component (dihydrolipoamide acetyltransferase)
MATLFKLPMLGQTMQEGTILKWHKAEGDRLEGWETLFEVMTDKVNMEVDPQVSGVLRKILAPEGAIVPVGAPVAIIGTADEPIDALLAEAGVIRSTTEPQSHREATGGPGDGATGRPDQGDSPDSVIRSSGHRVIRSSAAETFPPVSPRAREAAAAAGLDWKTLSILGTGFEGMIVERDVEALVRQTERPRVTPLAAKIAADLGVSAAGIEGTGASGRVTADDVRRHAEQAAVSAGAAPVVPSPMAAPLAEIVEIPLRGMRKTIADRLAESYRSAPHVPLRLDVDMTEAARLREQVLPEIERRWGARLTFTDLIAAAIAAALAETPALNATLEGDLLRQYPMVNLGIAVALEEGLIVPVVRDAASQPLGALAVQTKALAEKARAGRLTGEELTGATFTITNLGAYGIQSFDPILNPPQVGILGVGAIEERLVPREGQPAVRRMMTLTLTFDHRAVDGAPAARFLSRVRELLEKPYLILLNR